MFFQDERYEGTKGERVLERSENRPWLKMMADNERVMVC